jgi:hypothetical protein
MDLLLSACLGHKCFILFNLMLQNGIIVGKMNFVIVIDIWGTMLSNSLSGETWLWCCSQICFFSHWISTQIALQLRINFELCNWKWKNLESVKSSRGEERRVLLVGQVFHHQNSRYFVTLNMSHCKGGPFGDKATKRPKETSRTMTYSNILSPKTSWWLWVCIAMKVLEPSDLRIYLWSCNFLDAFLVFTIPSEFSWNSK